MVPMKKLKLNNFSAKYRSEMCPIPKKKTSRPACCINSPFKLALKNVWADWFKNTPPTNTPGR